MTALTILIPRKTAEKKTPISCRFLTSWTNCAESRELYRPSKRIEMVDADIDNKSRGSLSHLFKGTPKIDIRTDHGLDQFIGMVLDDKAQTVLADLGAGSTKETY